MTKIRVFHQHINGYNQGQGIVDPKARRMRTYRANHGTSEITNTASEWISLNNKGTQAGRYQKKLNKFIYED